MAKSKKIDVPAEVRAIARERIGPTPPGRPIPPKTARKKPKHKKPLAEAPDSAAE